MKINKIILIVSMTFSPIALILIAMQLFAFGLGEADDMQFIFSIAATLISLIFGIVVWVKEWKKSKLPENTPNLITSILTIILLEIIPYISFHLAFSFNQ